MYLPGQQSEPLLILPTHGPKIGETLVQVSGYSNITKRSERNVHDYKREIHTISTHGIKYPKAETQVAQSEGKKDRL